MKKNKSDLDEYRRKDDYKSEPAELSKLRDEIIKKEDINKNLTYDNRTLHQNIKVLNQEKVNLLNEGNRNKDELQRLNSRLEDTEKSYRSIKIEK